MAYETNKYNYTPRRVFDKSIEKITARQLRDRTDHRADMKALLQRLSNLEDQVTLVSVHQQDHCHDLDLLATGTGAATRKHGREGL